MDENSLQELLALMQPGQIKRAAENDSMYNDAIPAFQLGDDGEEYTTVGVAGALAATEKILAVSQGLVPADERDNLRYKKTFRIHDMLRERIAMDSGKIGRGLMYQAAKRKNLDGMSASPFEPYVTSILVGNPLSSPLEEINPMQLVESARRITQMGPGGLGSSQAITADAQNVNPSQFGFYSTVEGPECLDDQSIMFTDKGWIPVSEITMEHKIATELDGEMVFQTPSKVIHADYNGIMYTIDSKYFSFSCTPSHRCIGKKHLSCHTGVWTAEELRTKKFFFPVCRLKYAGNVHWTEIKIGDMTFNIDDWCELIGWFLSEGSNSRSKCKTKIVEAVGISQNQHIYPAEYNRIINLVTRMGINFTTHKDDTGTYICIKDKSIRQYFDRYTQGCYHRWIPEELFDAPLSAREKMYEAMMLGGGCHSKTNCNYTSVSKKLRDDFDRLCTSIGLATTINERTDKRPHVQTTSYNTSICKPSYVSARNRNAWKLCTYSSKVHCVTVPTGKVIIRRNGKLPIISGNSERAGIDVRLAWGAKIGSNGRIYQKVYDRRKKKLRWMSPEDLDGLVVKIPD